MDCYSYRSTEKELKSAPTAKTWHWQASYMKQHMISLKNWFKSISRLRWNALQRIYVKLCVFNGFEFFDPASILPVLSHLSFLVMCRALRGMREREFNFCHCSVSEWSEKLRAVSYVGHGGDVQKPWPPCMKLCSIPCWTPSLTSDYPQPG